jgi:hypothetical protein
MRSPWLAGSILRLRVDDINLLNVQVRHSPDIKDKRLRSLSIINLDRESKTVERNPGIFPV